MKYLFLAFLVISVALSAVAQDCKGYYYFNNSEIEMTLYDKKGSENGKVTYTVTDATKTAGGTSAKFTSVMNNEKGKLISKGAGIYKCNGGVMFIDAKVAMPGEQMSPYKDMEVKSDDVFIEYPSTLATGQNLKDVNFKMEVYNGAAIHSTITLEQLNRKVVSKESVTTPAGTWECFKITYDGKVRAVMAPLNIGIPFNYQSTEWYAPGFGLVKSETKNKNGKVIGTTAITAVKK